MNHILLGWLACLALSFGGWLLIYRAVSWLWGLA